MGQSPDPRLTCTFDSVKEDRGSMGVSFIEDCPVKRTNYQAAPNVLESSEGQTVQIPNDENATSTHSLRTAYLFVFFNAQDIRLCLSTTVAVILHRMEARGSWIASGRVPRGAWGEWLKQHSHRHSCTTNNRMNMNADAFTPIGTQLCTTSTSSSIQFALGMVYPKGCTGFSYKTALCDE